MSILIKGMKLPMKPNGLGSSARDLRIWDDGTIELLIGYHTWRTSYKAVELPPHGRLIDADRVINRINMNIDLYGDFPITHERMRRFIEYAQTIVEAEEGE